MLNGQCPRMQSNAQVVGMKIPSKFLWINQVFSTKSLSLENSEIESFIKTVDDEAQSIKDDIFRISWFMRGGVNSYDLFHMYSAEDRKIMHKIIKENVENTKSSRMPLL